MKYCILFAVTTLAFGADYYVAQNGSDTYPGTIGMPWATVGRAMNMCYGPGDRVFFRAGDTFKGRFYLNLGCTLEGTPTAPITIATYGAGRAAIDGGLEVEDKAGITLRNLLLFSSSPSNTLDGVAFYGTTHDYRQRRYIHIDRVEVKQFGGFGIVIGSWWADSGGYSDVRITNSVSHDNRKGGIVTYGSATGALYVNKNIYIGHSTAYNNTGYTLANFPAGWRAQGTGNGILLGSVDGALLEYSAAYNNGAENDYIDGPVGIMAYDSRGVVIQYCASYANKTRAHDGDGFSLDRNTSNSILRNNWSHDNYGVGLYLAQNVDQPYHFGNTVAYNLSQNDGRRGAYAGISLWGPMHGAQIYNNRVVVGPTSSGSPTAFSLSNAYLAGDYMQNISVHDNVFQTTGNVPLIYADPDLLAGSAGISLANNWFFAQNFRVIWGAAEYVSSADWTSATGMR